MLSNISCNHNDVAMMPITGQNIWLFVVENGLLFAQHKHSAQCAPELRGS